MKSIFKNIFILSLFFILFSCSSKELEDKKIDETSVLLDKNWNILFKNEKVILGNSWTTSSFTNIKQICETIKISEKFSLVEEKFWKAIFLSDATTDEKLKTSSYYYWKLWEDICIIMIEKWEIISKQYLDT